MANQEQLERLKLGVEGWNKWREENPDIDIDLHGAYLREANLSEANLKEADLSMAKLIGAILTNANLWRTELQLTDLSKANLVGANLGRADFTETNLSGADFNEAELREAVFNNVFFNDINLSKAKLGATVFGFIDLSKTKGLDECEHIAPSPISTSTLELSKGKIPEKFLRGCGLSDWEIESAKLYQPGLSTQEIDNILYRVHDLRANQAIQINPLFISYSHKDSAFVGEMERYLDEKGIRFWRDIHDATAGRLEKVVDRAIRQNPIMLLILSEHSVKSDWVEHEAHTARELEKQLGRDVLCPVALDEAWKTSPWSVVLREQIEKYNILDFSKWQDEAEFGEMFRKLIDGLDLFYKEG